MYFPCATNNSGNAHKLSEVETHVTKFFFATQSCKMQQEKIEFKLEANHQPLRGTKNNSNHVELVANSKLIITGALTAINPQT